MFDDSYYQAISGKEVDVNWVYYMIHETKITMGGFAKELVSIGGKLSSPWEGHVLERNQRNLYGRVGL